MKPKKKPFADVYYDDESDPPCWGARRGYVLPDGSLEVTDFICADSKEDAEGLLGETMETYVLECPHCKTTFEARAWSVGKPPFDVECPNCGEMVGSERIAEVYGG